MDLQVRLMRTLPFTSDLLDCGYSISVYTTAESVPEIWTSSFALLQGDFRHLSFSLSVAQGTFFLPQTEVGNFFQFSKYVWCMLPLEEGYIIFALSNHFVERDEEHEGGPHIFQNLSYLYSAPPTFLTLIFI